MRIDYIEPIIKSAIAVLAEFTGDTIERGDMKLHGDSSASKDVAAIIGIAGDVEGRIIIEMDSETAIAMAGIMNRDTFKELSHLALDGLMELANIIVARAVSSLNDQGYSFRLTPPLIFTGANLAFFSSLRLETLVIPLRTKAGNCNLNVSLRMTGL
jgi:chemotaxis protein CheX